jgi:predicted transcriptional regulator
MSDMVRFSVKIAPEMAQKLETMAKDTHSSKSDILRKALLIMDIAIDNKKRGIKLALVNNEGQKVSEIVGI